MLIYLPRMWCGAVCRMPLLLVLLVLQVVVYVLETSAMGGCMGQKFRAPLPR